MFQIFGILTYENTIFLFPVAILLSTPLTAQELTSNNYRKIKQLAGLGFVSMFFVFIPYAVYYILSKLPGIYLTHYLVSLSSSSLYERIFSFFAVFGQSLIHLAKTDVTDRGLAGRLYFSLAFAASGMIIFLRYYRNRSDGKLRNSNHGNEKLAYSMLFLSTIWLLIFGIVPYSFFGIASYRVYVTAMMGFPIVLLLLYQLSRGVWRILAVGAMLIWVLSAFVEFETKAFQIANSEEPYNYYYLSVYELVPDVKPDTWFVFVDFELGGWGCGPSLSMLYEKPDLFCARLSTRSPDYIADRYGGDILNVRNTGGWIRNGNMIIFGIDEKGKIYIIPEITPQSGVYVTWFSQEPIRTDFRRIVTDSSREMSPMAKHMYERRQILDTQ